MPKRPKPTNAEAFEDLRATVKFAKQAIATNSNGKRKRFLLAYTPQTEADYKKSGVNLRQYLADIGVQGVCVPLAEGVH